MRAPRLIVKLDSTSLLPSLPSRHTFIIKPTVMEPASKRRKRSTTSTTTTNDAEKADAAAEVGGSATIPSSGQSLLQNFALLPHELRIRIVKLACSLPSSSSATNHADNPPAASQGASTLTPSTSATPGVDTTTTLSLVRVSRSLYALATPIIFSHIWLTRASQVVELQRALAARPQLGYLVQSLHIGPDDELPHHCYPLHDRPCYDYRYPSNSSQHFDEHHMWIITSLRGSLGAQLRPHWCDDDTDWSLEREFELNCREMAVFKADVAAQRALDVNLLVEGSTMSGGTISVEKWTVRAYEVQAAHDLYLMHMRALEDSHTTAAGPSCPRRGCNRGPCPVYPPLHLEATPDAPQHDDDDKTLPAAQPFVLTRSQLLRHLARPGSITDRLDHPLLFARSGVDLVERATRFGSARFHRRSEFAAMPDNFAELSSMEDRINEHDSSSASSSAGVLDPTLPFAQTLGTILTLVRSIFCFTPLLRSLSLTGFLDRATSQLSSLSLAQLRHFSLGPPPPAWYWPLGFHKLASLHSLRVCGVELDSNEAIGIAVNTQTLRHLSISMAAKWHNSAEDSA